MVSSAGAVNGSNATSTTSSGSNVTVQIAALKAQLTNYQKQLQEAQKNAQTKEGAAEVVDSEQYSTDCLLIIKGDFRWWIFAGNEIITICFLANFR